LTNIQTTKGHIDSIESLRGVAALLIVFFHLVELAQLPLPSGLGFVRSHFGMGVLLFYALSGFVLAWGYSDRLTLGKAEIIPFYVRRFFRIAPLFYTVLIGWRGLGHVLWSWSDSKSTIILNMAFLFGLVPGEHESLVMAGWSVGIEMLFYFIFPVLIVLLGNMHSALIGFIISCFLSTMVNNSFTTAGLGSYAYMNLLTHLPSFIAGILSYRIWRGRNYEQGNFGYWLLAFVLILIMLMVKQNDGIYELPLSEYHRHIWSLTFALLIYSSCVLSPSWLSRGPLRWFGRMSFSAYLLHPLVLVSLIKSGAIVWLSNFGILPGFIFGSVITLALVCAVSYVSHRWIELPGIALGNIILANKLILSPLPIAQAMVGIFRAPYIGSRFFSWANQIGNKKIWNYSLYLTAMGAFTFFTYVTLLYIRQPLVDIHAFRQTQTALTSFWMLKEGWNLAYQTPVAGFPWAIPFEFPIYQTLVAEIVATTGFELEAVGRFVSYAFVVACVWPAFALSKRLDLPKSVPVVFCALLWTSPLNVYWGRTFMIETAALFFTLACLPFALDLVRSVSGWRSALSFLVFATAAVLQKSTTGGPVLLFLFLAVAFVQLRQTGLSIQTVRDAWYPALVICIPLVIGLAWAHYADVVKMANPFGSQLSSKALSQWNFGTMQQKLDPETWRLVVWERSFRWNAAGWLGVALLLLPWLGGPTQRKFAWLSLAATVLFLLPVLIFTNLHFVHEYYQIACVAFLLGALAIVIGGSLEKITGMTLIVPVVTLAIVVSNLVVFSKSYGIVTARTLDELDPRSVQSYKVGRFLRDHTQPGSGLVVFGQGYSSEIAYQAQRKTMAAPPWFKEYRQLWDQPQKYLGNVPLSAIVICPPTDDFPTLADMTVRLENEAGWKRDGVNGCEVLLKVSEMASNL
jgi:peptidoglycan/LPS O-acetylase OafA/YrhL